MNAEHEAWIGLHKLTLWPDPVDGEIIEAIPISELSPYLASLPSAIPDDKVLVSRELIEQAAQWFEETAKGWHSNATPVFGSEFEALLRQDDKEHG